MSQVAKIEPQETTLQPATPITPMALLERAMTSGAGLDVIDKFMGLQERWEKNQARKAFDEAIASAKAKIEAKGGTCEVVKKQAPAAS